VYTKISRGYSRVVKTARLSFSVLNVMLLGVLLAGAHLWNVTTTLPDVLYVAALVVTAVVISAVFTAYGAKIAQRLSAGLKMRVDTQTTDKKHHRDKYLYKVTREVVTLSATCLLGALLALSAKLLIIFVDYDDMTAIVDALQIVFEISMIIEMLLMVKPKHMKKTPDRSSSRVHLPAYTSDTHSDAGDTHSESEMHSVRDTVDHTCFSTDSSAGSRYSTDRPDTHDPADPHSRFSTDSRGSTGPLVNPGVRLSTDSHASVDTRSSWSESESDPKAHHSPVIITSLQLKHVRSNVGIK